MAYPRVAVAVIAFLLVAAVPAGYSAEAATADQFEVRTTADYVALCTTPPEDDTYQAATAFCYGFAVGAYQYYAALAEQSASYRYVCLPTPPPTRSSALTDFVAWLKTHQQYLPEKPVDTIFRYLQARYPCGQ
ncbi:Rap1a/Tai family immunity protein [Dongia soli]|uniref:Rap1a/Tai family immunity protein n=1 Tax=Dongia soli TaxID=600628 RepID=A0ABU5EEC1_9PROT|nr:Rap1a/Tai family immunity protein [Dongia soli]MDY0884573.1 Rap1a/Tai family immunity protein [Dongia soli]